MTTYYIDKQAKDLKMPYNDNDSQKILEAIDDVTHTHEPTTLDMLSDLVERLAFELRISPTILNLIVQSYWRGYGRGLKELERNIHQPKYSDNEDLK